MQSVVSSPAHQVDYWKGVEEDSKESRNYRRGKITKIMKWTKERRKVNEGRKGSGKQVRNKEQTRKNEGINGRIKEDRQKSRNKGRSRKNVE